MCLAIPGKVLEEFEQRGMRMAKVQFGGIVREASLDYVPAVRVGDYVLVHVGFAISTELLYTVRVSFREHGLLAESFLVVALIAVIRRVLVITAQIPNLPESTEAVFRHAIWELSLLTVMIIALVGSLIALQKQSKQLQAYHLEKT